MNVNEIKKYSSSEISVNEFEQMKQFAKDFAESNLFGVKTPSQAMSLMAIAKAEGRPAALAARDYHIVLGRPTLKADAMLSRFQQAGGEIEWHTYTSDLADATFTCPKGKKLRLAWTIEDAKRANLVKPDSGWIKYPRAMLRARLISEAIRTVFPEVICGFYSSEELEGDADFIEKDITPVQPNRVVDIIKKAKESAKKINKSDNKNNIVITDLQRELALLIEKNEISSETVNVWIEKSGNNSIYEFSDDFCNHIIEGINKKYGDKKDVSVNT